MPAEINNKTIDLKNLKPAKRYSGALLECGGNNSDILKDLEFLTDTVQGNDELKDFLENPVISKQDKKDVLFKVFNGRVAEYVLNFLSLLADENRLEILDDILISFKNGINEAENTVIAYITSAVELNMAQKDTLVLKLKNKTGRKIIPDFKVDSRILGGMIIKINDTVIDLSLKKRIDNLNNIIER